MKKIAGVFIPVFMLVSCQPKAKMTTIDHPVCDVPTDSSRGAASMEALSCYFYKSLRGDISFDELARYIPDSADIVTIYKMTKTEPGDANVKGNADTVLNQLHRQWIKTRSEAAELKANWSGADLEQLQLIEIENQKIPSRKVIISCKSGKTVLRASAKCMQIGDRWYIGEDIKFGV